MKFSKNARQMLTHNNYSGAGGVARPASAKSMTENRNTKEVVLNKVHKPFFRRAFSIRRSFSFRRNRRSLSTEEIETTSDESSSSADTLSEESVSDDDIETLPAKRGVSFKPTVAVIRGPSREKIVRIARSGTGDGGVGSTAGVRALWWESEDYALFRDACTILARTEAPDRSSDAEAHTALLAGTTTARDNSEDGCCATSPSVSWEDEHGSRSVDDGDDKGWWCEFGHSRRGIEHITQSALGRQRVAAAAMAKTAMLGEQMRTKMEGTTTSENLEEKLACVLMEHTGDAQDAAHRRGLEDAAAAAAVCLEDNAFSTI